MIPESCFRIDNSNPTDAPEKARQRASTLNSQIVFPHKKPRNMATTTRYFIIAGGDNVLGYASLDQLESLANSGDPYYSMFRDGDDWTELDDVFVTFDNRLGIPVADRVTLEGPLRADGFGENEDTFGLEVGFGFELSNQLIEDNAVIIKTAGEGALGAEWLPPSSDGETGSYYNRLIQDFQRESGRVEQITGEDRNAQLCGVIWVQGADDVDNDAFRADYQTNLENLIDDLRVDLNDDDLTVVIAELGQGGANPSANEQEIRDIQAAVAEADMDVYITPTAQYVPANPGNLDTMERYFGRADAIAQIGRDLARDSLDGCFGAPTPTSPTRPPTRSPAPTRSPEPTPQPVATDDPTAMPTTEDPSESPTEEPTVTPTVVPTPELSNAPSVLTGVPTAFLSDPPTAEPTRIPTALPTPVTNSPTVPATDDPTSAPTPTDTREPTRSPQPTPVPVTPGPTTSPQPTVPDPTPFPTTSPQPTVQDPTPAPAPPTPCPTKESQGGMDSDSSSSDSSSSDSSSSDSSSSDSSSSDSSSSDSKSGKKGSKRSKRSKKGPGRPNRPNRPNRPGKGPVAPIGPPVGPPPRPPRPGKGYHYRPGKGSTYYGPGKGYSHPGHGGGGHGKGYGYTRPGHGKGYSYGPPSYGKGGKGNGYAPGYGYGYGKGKGKGYSRGYGKGYSNGYHGGNYGYGKGYSNGYSGGYHGGNYGYGHGKGYGYTGSHGGYSPHPPSYGHGYGYNRGYGKGIWRRELAQEN